MKHDQVFYQQTLAALLHYTSHNSIADRRRRGTIPESDIPGSRPGWFAVTVAQWLATEPELLARVTDPDMLALVSEVKRTL